MHAFSHFWKASWSHIASHLAYFTGISMLLPVLGDAFTKGTAPWVLHPWVFWAAAILMFAGVFVLFWVERSIGKIMRVVGWMMLIPGMMALLFSFMTSDFFFDAAHNSITGFSVVEPGVEWIVHHSVPASVHVGAAYMFIGILMIWTGQKIAKIAHIL